MRYQVPQFIEVEDKIFGPLTAKQFLYVSGGAGLAFVVWNLLPSVIDLIVAIPVFIFFLMLAFYKFNDRPFILTVEQALKYATGAKIYIWKKEKKEIKKKEVVKDIINPEEALPKLSDSKLSELSWSLDINKNIK